MIFNKTTFLEKYALQEIDGIINDMFYNDMNTMDKLAYPMLFCLQKYGCMILTRLAIEFTIPKQFITNINYIFLNKGIPDYINNADSIIKNNYQNITLKESSPLISAGFAIRNNVFIYIPINPSYLPFGTISYLCKDEKYLPEITSEEIIKNIANKYITNLDQCLITTFGNNTPINTKKILTDFKQPIEELNTYYTLYYLRQKKTTTHRK